MSLPAFELDAPFEGRTAQVALRLARWGEIGGIAQSPLGAPAARLELQFDVGILRSVAKVDGKGLFGARAQALLHSPRTLGAIVEKRFELYQRVRAAGRLFAACPQCGHEIELTLLALFDTVGRLPPDPISADSLYFLPPLLGFDSPAPKRPEAVYASRFRFVLPTAALGLEHDGPERGVLQRVDEERAVRAMQHWAGDGVNTPLGRAWWAEDSVAFRATVRLGTAVRDLSPAADPTPEMFERMMAVDVYFLDALYWYLYVVDVPDHAPPRTCAQCGTAFLPIAR